MNPNSGNKDNTDKHTRRKAAIPMAGAIVTAAILLSGLSLIGPFQQPAIAQQENMTGTGGTTGGMTGGATTTDTNATTMGAGNTTMAGGAEGNDSMSQVRLHLEEARTALQNNDTQGALMHLDLALNALGGASGAEMNMTSTTGGTTGGTEGGGATGGTTGGTEGGGATGGNGGGILEGIFGGGGG
ncbi:MAG: hypothetical protein M3115_06075 [Thermoproteota archaeon]|nr:hypothetical protein [Thermoproteota archaeon]